MSAKEKAEEKDGDNSFVKRLMELPKAEARLVLIMLALKQPEEKRDELIAGIAETIRDRAHALETEARDFAADITNIADFMQKRQRERGEASEAERRLLECCDEGLAFLMRDSHGFFRAENSDSRELTCTACGAMHETDEFLRALRRDLELSEDEFERRDTLRYFANHVHRQSEELACLIETYPDAAKGIAGDYPNWPFLMFRRDNLPTDYKRHADLIGLGDTCAVNPSPRRNWTPLQRYLFSVFEAWQDVNRFMRSNTKTADFNTPLNWFLMRDGRTPSELVKVCLAEYPARPEDSISDGEAQLFLESFKLPPLTKTRESRRQWAELFLIPLIDLREADLEAIPAFAVWLEGDNMKVRDRKGMLVAIKEGVIRALEAMARDAHG